MTSAEMMLHKHLISFPIGAEEKWKIIYFHCKATFGFKYIANKYNNIFVSWFTSELSVRLAP